MLLSRLFLAWLQLVAYKCEQATSPLTACTLEEIVDVDVVPGLAGFWNNWIRSASSLHVDSGTSLGDWRFFMRWAYILTKSEEILVPVVGNCVFGVLTLILQALPAIQYERGLSEALRMLHMAQSIFTQVSSRTDFNQVVQMAESQGWQVQALERTLEFYSSILQAPHPEKVDKHAMHAQDLCSGLKFFVYELPSPVQEAVEKTRRSSEVVSPKLLFQRGSSTYLQAFGNGLLQCVFGMYGTEMLFHRFFQQHPCNTHDPSEATMFFIPSYFKCIEVINYVDHFNQNDTEAALLFQNTLAYVRRLGPWYDRFDGADHIMLFSWGRFPCQLPDWRLEMHSTIALQVEDQCEDLNVEKPHPSFSRWKDVIIPGHIDNWRVFELKSHNRPLQLRDVLISFHGRYAGNAETYANVTVRTQIIEELEGMPGVSVGGFTEGYHELLGRSIFCLAPRGITPWTIHLYVALLAGCIPIILSDAFELPFQDLIDWPSFSIKWPMQKAGKELYSFLSSLDTNIVAKMKKLVDANSCWSDYYSLDEKCSPFVAVLEVLKRRRQSMPVYHGRFWDPVGIETRTLSLTS